MTRQDSGNQRVSSLPAEIRLQVAPPELSARGVLYPLAWEELMGRRVGRGELGAILHLWQHPGAVVIGHRDRRLPAATAALEKLRQSGLDACVRPSGGAAVLLDSGVLNVSLIMPNPQHSIGIHTDFQLMAQLLGDAIRPWHPLVRAGEVSGSFCPGDYDLSINGRKFCGIAQRRQAKAYMITAFVIVTGAGVDRGRTVRSFYDAAADGSAHDYPQVVPETMGSLAELAGVPSVEAYIQSLLTSVQKTSTLQMLKDAEAGLSDLDGQVTALRARYDTDIK
ncbi:biotin/lipoate A/B protein ligase family protein [Paenibacillus massiliensis]|uniref:lipoate--protein ligase family protein n=1 Tax=Paenibacillus massiliensis TaxID=225917 RepID=UPI000470D6E7|nr:lipoate--protein ligase [Paenibacillus massiliensis]